MWLCHENLPVLDLVSRLAKLHPLYVNVHREDETPVFSFASNR